MDRCDRARGMLSNRSIIFTAIHPLGHATLEGDYKFNESLLGQSIVAIERSRKPHQELNNCTGKNGCEQDLHLIRLQLNCSAGEE